jgi:hypothetical protein
VIALQCVWLAPFSRNIQHFYGLAGGIICMSSFKYMLRIFRILLFISPNGIGMLLYETFKGTSDLICIEIWISILFFDTVHGLTLFAVYYLRMI